MVKRLLTRKSRERILMHYKTCLPLRPGVSVTLLTSLALLFLQDPDELSRPFESGGHL